MHARMQSLHSNAAHDAQRDAESHHRSRSSRERARRRTRLTWTTSVVARVRFKEFHMPMNIGQYFQECRDRQLLRLSTKAHDDWNHLFNQVRIELVGALGESIVTLVRKSSKFSEQKGS